MARRERPTLRRLAAILGAGQVVGRGALALYTVGLVRLLGRDAFGDLAYVMSIMSIAAVVADLGISRLLVRESARSEQSGTVVAELLLVRLAGSPAPILLAGAVTALADPSVAVALVGAGMAYALLESIATGFENAAVGVERPHRFLAAQAAAAAGYAAAFAVLSALSDAGATAAMLGAVAASALKVAVHLAVWRPWAVPRRPLRELPAIRWIRQSLPILALTVLATVYYRVGVIALHTLRGAHETAPLAAAFRVLDAVAVVGSVAFASMSPTFSRLHRDEPGEVHRLWVRALRRIAPPVLVGAAVLAAASHWIALAAFGPSYAGAGGRALAVLAPGMAFMLLQNVTAAVVFMADGMGAVLTLTAVNVAATVSLSFGLTALWGGTGAALAMSAAELISFASFAVLVHRRWRPR